jgi:N-formylglutamate deformylase
VASFLNEAGLATLLFDLLTTTDGRAWTPVDPAMRTVYHGGGSEADMVLGDAHGTACAPNATRMVEEILVGLGYRVRRNDPYAGGYVTRHYGRPREGTHALQVEIARALYMDEGRIERAPGLASLARDMTTLIGTLSATDWSFLRP